MLAQYRAVLSKPGALVFSSAAWVGRLWLSMTNLGILLLITATTHRYGIAGAVSATYAITGALGQPYLGRLTDRLGQARVLLPLVVVHAAGVVSLLLLADGHAPHWSLFAAALPTGLCCPPLGSQVRTRWAHLLGGGASWTPRTPSSRCSTSCSSSSARRSSPCCRRRSTRRPAC